MSSDPTNDRIRVVQGDITSLAVGAIVNAANETLLGGGGVDGAIHKAAGPKLMEECRTLEGCPTGQARITGGYDLPAPHVIHAVGPRYQGGSSGEAALLRSCYLESLTLANQHGIETLAFPCISTGIFGYPKDEACAIAIDAVRIFLRAHELPREVTFCCFDEDEAKRYRAELDSGGIELA
ncbi:O-acetyl-ADP-ribose deacetylase [Tautonia plasticadhaerens]|uniref:O-acetyl-ADP-ribose deacetylase n=1 Tax=Tautonia plasticadhaerens TaxID=2527974 RepID=A0A518GZE6_9BACT|nr:O-acetyl-ADP-ribose deacetylase [Tautonia plasticadhaerens]QDV33966.1 O-acetyl-ADP-ribose deacetylase [Tautonia plasticadhaerens]